ncbi:MAG: hypothetical protein ABI855_10095, partial [Bacteroidota bacterium]
YEFKGYKEEYEGPLKSIQNKFTDKNGVVKSVSELIQYEIVDFLDGRVCILYINELSDEDKFLYFNSKAFKRTLTGDHEISKETEAAQEEYKAEIKGRRELLPVPNATLENIDLNKLNEYIVRLNSKNHIHNLKSDLKMAMPFLVQKKFVINENEITTLGMLVCGSRPDEFLGFKAMVRCFLHTQIKAADDKSELGGNILDLMQRSLAFVLKSIQVGITRVDSGKDIAEYPEGLISESINNALAHRDYKIDDYVKIVITPNEHIEISNPGTFKQQLIVEELNDEIPFRRIIPSSKPINPNLAQVLSVFSKWEGLGNGMANLVRDALSSKTDLPYYKFDTSEKLSLFINKGKLLDDEMNLMFEIYNDYINQKLDGEAFTDEMKEAFSYLYKSELQNQKGYYTILLTSDNNHFDSIQKLLKAKLISRHNKSPKYYDIYVTDRVFFTHNFGSKLMEVFGEAYNHLKADYKTLLQLIYQYNLYNKSKHISASKASNILWFRQNKFIRNQKEFDDFKRRTRTQFNNLEKKKYVIRKGQSVHTTYELITNYETINTLL